MAVFKCKMCGGTIEFEQGATVGVCDSCGSRQTLPKLDDDKKANLYDRANHFRRNNDYDKAMGIYEQILNEDASDAEAYWSLVLCRYGIEYVEDPATHKRVPTVNRAQFTSIFDDEDYKSALAHADMTQKMIYEGEAAAINEIQKGILAISQKEEPFDVFICYKETDNDGRRTQDSVLANDLYHQLTQEGFKVFFSRITLEDKLGTAYEPYIFAALNSAKVMVVLGTKPEYFNAVWVKNEWSRYLALIRNGAKKMLIPAYRDMDPYDLPEEFSHLQAQDMSKLGFMQDLIRGIKKIVGTDEPKQTVKETVVVNSGNANTEPLLKRAFMFLEDGNWQEADEYCERVLDIDPECAEAYLGKLMAERRVNSQENLKNTLSSLAGSNNFVKAVRYGNEQLVNTLKGYEKFILDRNEKARLELAYKTASELLESADTQSKCEKAAEKFDECIDYKDSAEKKAECLEKAEDFRKDSIYLKALECRNFEDALGNGSINKCQEAIQLFKSIPDWRDANAQIPVCEEKIKEIKVQLEENKIKRKKAIKIAIPVVILCFAAIIVFGAVIPNIKYNKAMDLYESGKYYEALLAFEDISDHNDSSEMIEKCNSELEKKYKNAKSFYAGGEYEKAIACFEEIKGYKDSESLIEKYNAELEEKYEKYESAMNAISSGDYVSAYESLEEIGDYKDAKSQMTGIFSEYKLQKLQKLKIAEVGDTLYFGNYEQDNVQSNGKENIEWRVLDKKEDKILLISEYALDVEYFGASSTKWKDCNLRSWLNYEFLSTAFDTNEIKLIKRSKIKSKDGSDDTQDRIFIIREDEADKYFASNDERICKPTEYAIEKGAKSEYSDGCWWWVRISSKKSEGYYAVGYNAVCYDGSIGLGGHSGYYDVNEFGVRPAMWVSIE